MFFWIFKNIIIALAFLRIAMVENKNKKKIKNKKREQEKKIMEKKEAMKILNKIIDNFENLDIEIRRDIIDYFCAHYGWVRPG